MMVMPGGRGHGQGEWLCTCQSQFMTSMFHYFPENAAHTFLRIFYSIHIIRLVVPILVPDSLAKEITN